ncbi:MAG: ABC transporter substrate-binding protein [Synergistaceae bacterium]|jgi:sn-glycerol 3-phosphate transport system substrate-binding protein|nr:ABC transporter substrate-binding protein [Synergistaceae bacterium]
MRKIFALLAALAAIISAAALPGPSFAAAKPIELTFWYSWTDKIQENNINLAKMFNETRGKELNIQVTAEYQGTYNELHQKLQAAFVAGKTPSVTVMEIASIKRFAESGVILPLSPYIERDKIDMDDFYKGLLINCNAGGTWYGLPYLRSTPILYMNTTLLEKAGLDPSGPKTWDELAEYCKTVKEKTGAYGITLNSDVWIFEAFMFENGVATLTPDESHSNINSPESRSVFAFFKDLVDKGYVRCVAGEDYGKVAADIMNQKTAMFFNSTADLTYNLELARENGYEINTCFIPSNKSYGVPTGGCNLVLTSRQTDEEREAAWEFIKWMTETKQAAYAHAYTGYVATRKSTAASPEIQALYKEKPQFKVALDQLEQYGHGRPMNPGYAQVIVEWTAAMDAIWSNGADIDSTLAAAEAKIVRMNMLAAK